jgi:hypothetical protein
MDEFSALRRAVRDLTRRLEVWAAKVSAVLLQVNDPEPAAEVIHSAQWPELPGTCHSSGRLGTPPVLRRILSGRAVLAARSSLQRKGRPMGTSTPGTWPPAPRPAGGSARAGEHGRRPALNKVIFVLVILAVALIAWSATRPDTYDNTGGGCVTVMLASSTGGVALHECGARARALCRSATTGQDKLTVLTREQCARAHSRR